MEPATNNTQAAGEADNFLVAFGGPVKLLERKANTATVGGMLVRFTDPNRPDLTGDFFSSGTHLGPDLNGRKFDLYYQHGYDGTLKRRVIGTGVASVVEAGAKDVDPGVWFEAQLQLRDEYERMILDLVERGALAYSSGAVGHLVERSQVGKSWHLDQWPLGEASLTPNPAEPLNLVSAKQYKGMITPLEAKTTTTTAEEITIPIKLEIQIPTKVNEAPRERGTEAGNVEPAATVAEPVTIEEPKPVKKMEPTQEHPALETFTKAQMAAIIREALSSKPGQTVKAERPTAPAVIPSGHLGDDNDGIKAFFAYLRGKGQYNAGDYKAVKASNDTDMNVGTAADGGNLVPTGHVQGIVARRDEQMLARALGCMLVPGKGTTVDIPRDNEADGEFVSTAEAVAADRDAPAVGKTSLTLVKYTKKIEVSYELLNDEDSNLMSFLNNFVGRGMAKTHNDLLVTEVETNGTNFKTFASATAIAAGELEDIEGDDDLGGYLEDNTVAWVMRNSTLAAIRSIVANDRYYGQPDTGGPNVRTRRTILEYPVFRSNKVDAIATGNKSVLFGNWAYVAYREAPGMTFLLDPFSKADNGQIVLRYYFRTDYGVVIPEAIGYADQA